MTNHTDLTTADADLAAAANELRVLADDCTETEQHARADRLSELAGRLEQRASTGTTVLIIRDPDHETSWASDAPICQITVDIGRAFSCYRDLEAKVAENDDDAVGYVECWWNDVRHLPDGNPVRTAMTDFLKDLGVDVDALEARIANGGQR